MAYWRGGTRGERNAADLALRDCVLERTANTQLANIMHEGVRVGGSPYFDTWYRWGYGWGYDRKYQALSEAEIQLADSLLEAYLSSEPEAVCPVQ